MELWELSLILLVGMQVHSVIEGRLSVTGTDSSSNTAYLDADQYLTSYGYYPSSDLLPTQVRRSRKHSDTERTKALKLFQKFYNLPQSGKLDKETTQLMQRPRCGHPDITPNPDTRDTPADLEVEMEEDVGQTRNESKNQGREETGVNVDTEKPNLDMSRKKRVKRMKGQRKDGMLQKWGKLLLQWKITKPSKQKHLKGVQRQLVRKALSTWQPILPFRFWRNRRPEMLDMKIVFHSFSKSNWQDKDHSGFGWRKNWEDEEPDPGWYYRTKTWLKQEAKREHKWNLAELDKYNKNKYSARRMNKTKIVRPKHAPKMKGSYAHAMIPMNRNVLSPRDIHIDEDHDWSNHEELLSVLLHEIGHFIGLGHTNDEKAVMYPFNRDATQLALSDIEGIETVYGPHYKSLHRHKCDARLREVDHVFYDPIYRTLDHPRPGAYYVISGKKLQKLLLTPDIYIRTYRLYEMVFNNAPSKFDVVFGQRRSHTVFFIAGNTLYNYYQPIFTPMPVRNYSKEYFPETPKLSVAVFHEGKDHVQLFGEKYRWTFEFTHKLFKASNIIPLDDLTRQRISKLKFAVQWRDGFVYVVTRNGSWFSYYEDENKPTDLKPGYPPWMETHLCPIDPHAASISGTDSSKHRRMSSLRLVLVIMLSLIKLY